MATKISKLVLTVLATLLVLAAVATTTTIAYAEDVSTDGISLKDGWYPCNDKGKEISTTFTYDDPAKINVRPVQRITNGKDIVVINKEKDISVDYLWNNSAGKAYALVHGSGNYKDKFIFSFLIVPNPNKATNANELALVNAGKNKIEAGQENTENVKINMNDVEVSVPQETRISNGQPYEPQPIVRYNDKDLIQDIDYKVAWRDNISAGTATVTVTGEGGYEGIKEVTFEISEPKSDKHSDSNSDKKRSDDSSNKNTSNETGTRLFEGQSKQVLNLMESSTFKPGDPVQYTSSNEAVATVDSSGVVTAVGGGSADINIQATDGSGRTEQCQIVVKTGQDIVDEARKALGVKYVWGGSSLTDGMDCSGLVVAVYKKVLGAKLPHFTGDLEKSDKFVTIDVSELRPGDILVRYGPGHKSGKHIRHTGIWTGTGIIEESGGDGKCIESDKESKVKSWLANYTPRRYVG